MVKNLPANAGVVTDVGSIPGSRRSPRGGHGNPLQHSCLEKPMDRGAWRAPVQGVTQSRTRLKYLCTRRRRGSSGFSEPFRDTSHTGELPSLSRGSSGGGHLAQQARESDTSDVGKIVASTVDWR